MKSSKEIIRNAHLLGFVTMAIALGNAATANAQTAPDVSISKVSVGAKADISQRSFSSQPYSLAIDTISPTQSQSSASAVQGNVELTQSIMKDETFSLRSLQLGLGMGVDSSKNQTAVGGGRASLITGLTTGGLAMGLAVNATYDFNPGFYLHRDDYWSVLGGIAFGVLTPVQKNNLLSILLIGQAGGADNGFAARGALQALYDTPSLRASLTAAVTGTNTNGLYSNGFGTNGMAPALYSIESDVLAKIGPVSAGAYGSVSVESGRDGSNAGGVDESQTNTVVGLKAAGNVPIF